MRTKAHMRPFPHIRWPYDIYKKGGVNFMNIIHRHPIRNDDARRSAILAGLYRACVTAFHRR